VFPAFGLVRPTFSQAESWYDSLQASARMRPVGGLSLLASYTWSHARDHVSGLNIGGEARPPLPVVPGDQASIDAALARQKGDALFDVRHRFVVSFAYELPAWPDRSRAGRALLAGWQVNGIVQAQTGFPLTVAEPAQSLLGLPNRPNQVCDPNENAPRTVDRWFATDCFQRVNVAADPAAIGDAGRNTIRGPGFARTDLSLFKNVPVWRRHQLQVRIEAFNLFNQARFGQPGETVGSPTYGVITSAQEGRIIQLGVRYTF
jgi:outer membrane receptor protein involved in Fe transport